MKNSSPTDKTPLYSISKAYLLALSNPDGSCALGRHTLINNAIRGEREIAELLAATGAEFVKDVVTLPLERLALMHTISVLQTEVQITSEQHLQALVRNIYQERVLPAIEAFQTSGSVELHDQLKQDVESSFQRVRDGKVDPTNPVDIKMQETCELVEKREKDGQYNPGKYNLGESRNSAIQKIVYDALYKERAESLVEHIAEAQIEKALEEKASVNFVPDGKTEAVSLELERLPIAVGEDRITGIIAGPTACGKGIAVGLFEEEAKALGVPKEHIVKINTDHYRTFFSGQERLGPDIRFHSLLNQDEANLATILTIARLKRLTAENKGRHIMLDTVAGLDQDKIDFGTAANGKLIVKIMTLDPAIAIQRSIVRGEKEGRFVPVEYMIKSHQGVGKLLLDVLSNNSGRSISATVYDNDVSTKELPRVIFYADLSSASARILNPDLLEDVIRRRYMIMNPQNTSDVHFDFSATPTPTSTPTPTLPISSILEEAGYRVYKGYEPEMPDYTTKISQDSNYTKPATDTSKASEALTTLLSLSYQITLGMVLWHAGKNIAKKAQSYLFDIFGPDATKEERTVTNKVIKERFTRLDSSLEKESTHPTKVQILTQDLLHKYKESVDKVNILYHAGKKDTAEYKKLREHTSALKSMSEKASNLTLETLELSEQFEQEIKKPLTIKKRYLDEFAEKVMSAETKFNELTKAREDLYKPISSSDIAGDRLKPTSTPPSSTSRSKPLFRSN